MKRLLALLAIMLASSPLFAQDVFYSTNADHPTEVAAAAGKLATSLGGTATGFNSGVNAEWVTALAGASVILIGQGAETGSVDAPTRSNITTWVNGGGVLLVLWDNANLTLANDILGSSMAIGGFHSTDANYNAIKQAAVAGTTFDSAPDILLAASNHQTIDPTSLAPEGVAAYVNQFDEVEIMVQALGSGVVGFYSWDWCCSITPEGRGDWDLALLAGATFTGLDSVDVAGITVTKTFSDGLITDVEVAISCNDGFVSVDTATVSSDGGSHRFVITDFISGSMDCDITESGTDGYESDSCTFTDMTPGEYTCDLFNDAEDGSFSVTKAWDILGQDVDTVDQDVTLVIDCESDISNPAPLPCSSQPDSTQCVWDLDWDGLGLGDSVTASVDVDTSDGDAYCTAYETGIDASEVESSDDCDPRMLVEAAGSNGCTITNTVFFEGIPTLSQYGLALMALLMLGVGMIGFRRFA